MADFSQRTSDGVDEFLDGLFPESFPWRRMVRDYPIAALSVAGIGGFWLGRRHGSELLSGLFAFGTAEASRVAQQVASEMLGDSALGEKIFGGHGADPGDVEPDSWHDDEGDDAFES